MTNTNRADRIEQLYKTLKKHFKPTTIATDRPVLDLLLYACCLENSKFESADEAFAKLQQTYFDWNEVRVTTVAELGEVVNSLPSPMEAAKRIKMSLQSLFESRYSFEIDELRKANLGKTVGEMEAWTGVSKFVVAFVTQNALGGHSIPVDSATLEILKLFEIVTPSEADKGTVPGLERTIAKSKGPEFATLLHQFAAEFSVNPKSPLAIAVFKELGVNPKPKPLPPPPAPVKKPEPPKPAPTGKVATGKGAPEPVASKKGTVPLKPEPAKGISDKVASVKGAADKGSDAKKIGVKAPQGKPIEFKKVDGKRPELKKPEAKQVESKKPESKKPELKKPEPKKAETKKGEAKKPELKKPQEKGVDKGHKKQTPPPKTTSKPAAKKPNADTKKSGNTKSASGAKGLSERADSKSSAKPMAQKITKKKPK